MHLQTKQDIRTEILRKRKGLDAAIAAAHSRTMEAEVMGSELLRNASVVLAYVSAKDNEVDTHGIIRRLLEAGRTVYVPLSEMNSRVMQWSRLLGMEELEPARFGLLEPAPEYRRIEPVPDGAVCLVPGVAFTRAGWRIGFGGGYFDRFLAGFSGVPIGLAHDVQVIERIPTDAHDQPVDYLVTELGITNCAALRRLESTSA